MKRRIANYEITCLDNVYRLFKLLPKLLQPKILTFRFTEVSKTRHSLHKTRNKKVHSTPIIKKINKAIAIAM